MAQVLDEALRLDLRVLREAHDEPAHKLALRYIGGAQELRLAGMGPAPSVQGAIRVGSNGRSARAIRLALLKIARREAFQRPASPAPSLVGLGDLIQTIE